MSTGFDARGRTIVASPAGEVFVGGAFVQPRTGPTPRMWRVARWTGTAWAATSAGNDLGILTLLTLPNGDVIAGGRFASLGGVDAACVARWNGVAWSPIGTGISGANGSVHALAALPNGDLIAGGAFETATGAPANYIARWNGTAWLPLGLGVDLTVNALAVLPNGDLIAGGFFAVAGTVAANRIARWDGVTWSALGSGVAGSFPTVDALLALPNGDLIVGGSFSSAGGVPANRIARWSGGTWSALGAGVPAPVRAMATLPDGRIVAVGGQTTASLGYEMSFDGTTWTQLGAGLPFDGFAMTRLPNGDLVVGGEWGEAEAISRWNGTSWTPIATSSTGRVYALASKADGELLVGGEFLQIDGVVSCGFARRVSTCVATAVPVGAGCAGNTLAATSPPWIGTNYTAVATGLPSPSLTFELLSFSALNLPLAAVLPQAAPGCQLLASPDFLTSALVTTGSMTTTLALPNQVWLIGVVLRQQIGALTFDAGGNLLAATSTNALELTIGTP
jgi:hypothetical protein